MCILFEKKRILGDLLKNQLGGFLSRDLLSVHRGGLSFHSLPLKIGPLKFSYESEGAVISPLQGLGQSPGRSRILLHCTLTKRIWLQYAMMYFWFLGSGVAKEGCRGPSPP